MRISTSSMFESNVGRINDTQSSLAKVQQQISTGKRLLTPADDPLGAARALDLGQGQALNAQYTQNRSAAKDALNMQEGALQGVTDLLQDVRTQVVAAGSGSLDDTSRKYIATDLRSRLQQLTSLANSRDGVGNYLFAGFKDNAAPFTTDSKGAVSYNGDSSRKLLQVGASRQMVSNDSGDAVFMSVPASLLYTASSKGSAAMTSLVVTDSSLAKPGHQYQVDLDPANGGNYTVYDTTADPDKKTALATGAFLSPQTIKFDGIEMVATGTPTTGDSIVLKPMQNQSVFDTMNDLIATLEKPAVSETDRKMLNYKLSAAGENIDNALDKVLTTRASVGSRLKELDSLDQAGSARDVQYADQLSTIQDVDYVKAISDLSQKQLVLQASQKSFVEATKLSLFNYL